MRSQFSQVTSIVLLFLVIMGTVLFILPMREKVAALKVSKDTVGAELETLQADYQALSTLSEEVATSETTRQTLMKAVPSGFNQDEFLLEMDEMAKEAGFTLNAVNFTDTVHQEFGTTLNVTANFTGSYAELITFLQQIESADRLLRVTSMNVQRLNSTGISFNVNIEAYYQ